MTLRSDPSARNDRQHPLKGELGTRSIGRRILEEWQHEVTGAGLIWHAIDDERRTVVLTLASVGHPKGTE